MDENYNGNNPGGSNGHPPLTPPAYNGVAPVAEKRNDTLGIIALIAGIVALLAACCPPLGIVLGIAALICGIIGKSKEQRFAMVGVILGIIALLLAILFIFLGSALSLYLPDFINEIMYQIDYY